MKQEKEIAVNGQGPDIPSAGMARYGWLLCLLLVIGVHLWVMSPMIDAPTNPMDEGMVLVYPELLGKGMLAQRDFETLYPPGNIWLLDGIYKILGTDIYVERVVGLCYQVLLLCGIFTLFRVRGLLVAMAGCLLSSLVMLRLGLAALAWIGGVAWGVWALVAMTQVVNPRWRAILTGVLMALSVTWRADLAPALLLGVGSYMFLAGCRGSEFGWLVLAGAVTLIPLGVHALVVTPALFYDNIFYTPVIRCHNGRAIPLSMAGPYAERLFVLLAVSIGTALGMGLITWRRKQVCGTALVAAGFFALGLMPQAMQRADISHLCYVGAFVIPLLVFAASFVCRHWITPVIVSSAIIIAAPQLVRSIVAVHSAKDKTFWVIKGDRMIGVSLPVEQKVVDYLKDNARPGESLFVGTEDMRFTFANDVDLYHLFPELRPASYYLEFNPNSANRPGSRLASDLEKADWIVLDGIWGRTHEPNGSDVPGSDAANEVIRKMFRLVYAAPPFEIYRRQESQNSKDTPR